MTTYEHAMLGVTGVLAAGLHRREGWPLVATAAVAAVLPDWDGLSMLFGVEVFDHVHRAAGHNLLAASLLGACVAGIEYRYRLMVRGAALVGRFVEGIPAGGRADGCSHPPRQRRLAVWLAVGVAAGWSHLGADLLFSGHREYSDWGLKLLWPFSDRAWAYPLIYWGDVVPTLIFAAGMFAMLGFRRRVQPVAVSTLLVLAAYIGLRGFLRA